ncbi:MAG: hypothetical protein HQL24_09250 [Candidatus Omnitrophica bacterium]|nr:hypothetical protein [Candidatus Omnitrophota bacterium]
MKYFVIFPIIIFILAGCSDAGRDDPLSESYTVQKTTTQQQAVQAGKESLKGSAQTQVQSNYGSYQMNSTADNFHYSDKTKFDDGTERNSESWGK